MHVRCCCRVQKAEADAAKAQEQLAQAQQAASNAEVKATSLQKVRAPRAGAFMTAYEPRWQLRCSS